MREFVLNDASLPAEHDEQCNRWLIGIARGMGVLVDGGFVKPSLRSRQSIYEIECAPGTRLSEAFNGLMRIGHHTESLFPMQLANLTPIRSGLDEFVTGRFLLCQAVGCNDQSLTMEMGEPLVLCAITGAIAASFPSDAIWDRDELEVVFKELLPNEQVVEATETVNSIANESHGIIVRDRLTGVERASISTYAELWDARSTIFPDLVFGPEVQQQLGSLNAGWVTTVKEKLARLNDDARNWRRKSGPAPAWSTKVSDESDRVKRDLNLRHH